MNILQTRWSKFKQEFFTILFVSLIQIWFNFKFPAFIKLGTPLSTIVSVSCSIFTTLTCIVVFSMADQYLPQFNLKGFDTAPEEYREKLKSALRISLFVSYHLIFLYIWWYDYYNMPSFYYVLFYVYCVIVFSLMARAITRQPLLPDTDII